MLDWLREKRQTPRAIERFWRQVLVSAINEDLDRMAAVHGFQVFWLGFLAAHGFLRDGRPRRAAGRTLLRRGVDAPAATCASASAPRSPGSCGSTTSGHRHPTGGELAARPITTSARCPSSAFATVLPEAGAALRAFEHSPITGIHLWFDRPVTDLPHATLLDRTIQWMFNKDGGRYLQLVVSASRISGTDEPRRR